MIPVVASILSGLAANGLNMLAGALQAKGKELIEEKLGVKLPDDAAGLTPELVAQLKIKELEHEEFLVNAQIKREELNLETEKAAAASVTDRWRADMSSDSWLSKNIRPMVLIYLLTAYTLFALMSAAGITVTQAYVELLGQWGMMVMSAYFLGRTVEKGIDLVQKRKDGAQ